MKNIHIYFFILISFSFTENCCYAQDLSPAAKEILDKINFIEKQFKRFEREKSADFSTVNEIVELSQIIPKVYSIVGHVIYFQPEKNDIILWKDWFEKNKMLISYYENEDVSKYYFAKRKEKIFQFEYKTNKFRYSYSQPEMERILETTEQIKKDQIARKKN